MSVNDFFAKKSKKKSKGKINTLELYEKIADAPQPLKVDSEKAADPGLAIHAEENDGWDPIVNDDVEFDLSTMRINDLSVAKAEQEQIEVDNLESANQNDESKAVWTGKVTETPTEEESKPKPVESSKPSAYVPIHLRSGGGGLNIGNLQAQPNIESVEEFPTLDAAKEKPKKQRTPEKQETESWTEVSRSQQGHRMDSGTPGAYVSPALRSATSSEFKPAYSSGSSYRQNLESRFGDLKGARDDAPWSNPLVAPSQGWSRGEIISRSSTSNSESTRPSSNWTRGGSSSDHKPYQIYAHREVTEFTQENRFARLNDV